MQFSGIKEGPHIKNCFTLCIYLFGLEPSSLSDAVHKVGGVKN